jgi:hypothetical protein
MPIVKRLGKGTQVKLGTTVLGCLMEIEPPAKERESVDVTCLDDTVEDYLDSDPPKAGILKFKVAWQPGETNGQLLDTLFDDADMADRVGAFSIVWTQYANAVTWAFSGRILKMTPEKIDRKSMVSRTIEVQLTTAIVQTIAS